jgi:hypothetical protein
MGSSIFLRVRVKGVQGTLAAIERPDMHVVAAYMSTSCSSKESIG